MRIFQEEFEHPTGVHRVRVSVFELREGDVSLGESGFLVGEERLGTAKVVATLGLYPDRESALARARGRVQELTQQRYRPGPKAA